jgi:aspartyl-tRNA(Asn)/glutamyl-tRNA(Gln) amidotransferase subunit A
MTAEDLVEQCLEAITRRDDEVNAFITILADEARSRASQADREIAHGQDLGILHGIPLSIKDLIDMKGQPTTAASKVRAGHRATSDAPIMARLKAAGVVVVGKCNLHEFAFGTTGDDSAFGPTRNPLAPDHSAGGSSSGSAASVAAGMALASVGTDTGGSIRIPAAACGVVGLKPTRGELSTNGVVPLSPTLDHVGPLGLTVDDVTVVYRAMVGDPVMVEEHQPDERTADHQHQTTHLGVPTRYFLDLLDTDVRDAFEATLTRLRETGCHINEVNIPHADTIATTYRHTQLYEAFRVHRHTLESHPDDYSPDVYKRLESGRALSEKDYWRAQRDRLVLQSDVDSAMEGVSALVLPTLAFPAPPMGSQRVVLGGQTSDIRSVSLRLTQLFNLTGHPAITLPCGTTPDGLPCATQLVGRRDKTRAILALASHYELIIHPNRPR